MKKISGYFHIAVFIIISVISFLSVQKVYAQNDAICPGGGHKGDENTIVGRVSYLINSSPPESTYAAHGIVKLFKVNPPGNEVTAVDSVQISNTGYYAIFGVPQGDYYIVAYPGDKVEDYMPAFYPSGQLWSTASKLILSNNQVRTCNIKSIIMNQTTGGTPVRGEVADSANHNYKLKNSIIIAKSGNQYRGFAITDGQGKYLINSLVPGNYILTASRFPFGNQSQSVVIGTNQATVNFYIGRDTSSTIGISENTSVIKNFKLYQNYPNPFNPSTKISFSLDKGMNVRLSMYSMDGKFISDLINGYKPAGEYSVNMNGENLSTGIYSYVLETGEGQRESKIMVLTK